MKTAFRRAGIVLLLLVLLAGFWLLVGREGTLPGMPGERPEQPVAVAVAPVVVTDIQDRRLLSGTLQPNAQFDVAARIGGRVEAVLVELGDAVQRGQVVAQLDDVEAAQELAQAQAALAVAEASREEAASALSLAQAEHRRIQQLRQRGIASQAELEQARAESQAAAARHKLAEAQVLQSEAALRVAEVHLADTRVRATWGGEDGERLVSQRHVDPGATLAANAPVVSILDLDPLVAVVNVTERDYVRLQRGQAATVTSAAHGERAFAAEVVRLAPRLDEASRQARVELRVPNPDGALRPGMFVQVAVVLESIPDATVVPQDALVRREDRTGVFLTDEAGERVRFVPVHAGVMDGDRVQILEPALEGRVVTLGQHLLRDGAAILATPVGDETAVEGPPR